MEEFLNNCGLSAAIGTFQNHNIKIEQVGNLLTEEIKELLPKIGDREIFRSAIEKLDETRVISKRRANNSSLDYHESKRNCMAIEENVEKVSKGPQKKDLIIEVLMKDEAVKAELIHKASKVAAPYLFEKNRRDGSGWEMVDYNQGKLNCPLCPVQIMPQYRRNSYFDWMVENYRRHLEVMHGAVEYLEYQDDTSCEQNITQIVGEQGQDCENNATNAVTSDGENGIANSLEAGVPGTTIEDVVDNGIENNVSNGDKIAGGVKYGACDDVDGVNDDTNNATTDGIPNAVEESVPGPTIEHVVKNGIENNVTNGDEIAGGDDCIDVKHGACDGVDDTNNASTDGIPNAVEESVPGPTIEHVVKNGIENNVANGDEIAGGNDCINVKHGACDGVDDTNNATTDGIPNAVEESVSGPTIEDVVKNGIKTNVANDDEIAGGDDCIGVKHGACDGVEGVNNYIDNDVENGIANANQLPVNGGMEEGLANADAIPNEDDDIPDWRKSGATFGWMKFHSRDCFFPGFLYDNRLAQYITTTGEASTFKRPIYQYEINVEEKKKRKKIKNLIKFNQKNGTDFS